MQCNCFTCPLGKDSYEQRLKTYDALNMGYNYDEIVYNIWCDKIGSKCGWYGYCDDAFNENIKPKIKVNKKMSDKRIRQEKYINKLKRLNKIAYYPSPAMYVEEKWDKELRDYIKAANALANQLTHKRSATKMNMLLTMSSTFEIGRAHV